MREYDDTGFRVFKQDGKIITHLQQNTDTTIQEAKIAKEVHKGDRFGMKHAATIPMAILLEWGKEDAGDQLAYLQGRHSRDPELARKLAIRLNSNEFHRLRVWDGNIAASDIYKEAKKF